jgi:hypothetical protein
MNSSSRKNAKRSKDCQQDQLIQGYRNFTEINRKKRKFFTTLYDFSHLCMIFHIYVIKGMYLCKCAMKELLPGIVCLATRVKESNEGD